MFPSCAGKPTAHLYQQVPRDIIQLAANVDRHDPGVYFRTVAVLIVVFRKRAMDNGYRTIVASILLS